MFDFNKLGDMAKLASQAMKVQEKQDDFHCKQLDVLGKISRQLEEIAELLKQKERG